MFTTERLILRRWKEEDRAPFAAMNADNEVMRYFPAPLTQDQSDALVDKINAHFSQYGYGLWAVEEKQSGEFIGFVGLATPSFEAHFTPCTEIGWRLAYKYWKKGYATEAAKVVLDYAFSVAGLEEVVSFTAKVNVPSQAVMQRLGMAHDHDDDFEHPLLEAEHPLRSHVLYRMSRVEFEK